MLWLDHLADPTVPDVPGHAWAIAWALPFAWAGSVAMALAAFERLAYRFDPGNHAGSSVLWSLRGVLPALLWCPLALLFEAVVVVDGPAGSLPNLFLQTLQLFLIGTAANLVAARPPRRWRIRWPGWLNFAIWVVPWLSVLVVMIALGEPEPDIESWPPAAWAAVAASFVLGWFVSIALDLLWLNRARNGVLAEFRMSFRARVFMPMALRLVRLFGLVPLLLLPLVPVAVFLVQVVPQFEPGLGNCGCCASCCGDCTAGWLVFASREAVKWWWLVLLGAVGVYSVLPWSWWQPLSANRLLVELGAVRADVLELDAPTRPASPTPPTHPDSGPAATSPPTA